MAEDISLRTANFKTGISIVLMGSILFVLGGRRDWPQAWIYLALYSAWACGMVPWLKKYNPELLRKRLLTTLRAKTFWDKAVIEINFVLYVCMMFITSFDAGARRPEVPLSVNILGFAGLIAGYVLILYTFKVNSYAVKTVEVEPGQKVVSSGPYAFVRHPMYAGSGLLYLSTPAALGSWYGFIPAALMFLTLVVRSYFEERTLKRELPGYAEYAQKVRSRFIPGIW